MARSPADVAKAWKTGLQNSTAKINAGIDAVTESPMQKAAAKKDKWIQGVQDAANNGSYERGLQSVTLAEWKRRFKSVGVQRISQGAADAESKVATFMSKFLPQVEQIRTEIQTMPDNTFDERLQRMVANANRLHELKGTFKS